MGVSVPRAEEPRYGLTLSLYDPITVEMASRAGYSFIRIDWEHMIFDSGVLSHMIRVARLMGIAVHVRVSSLSNVTALLDLGVNGIMIPGVSTTEMAEEAVRCVKYAPLGGRGMNSGARALDFGRTKFADYQAYANDEVKLIVQIEGADGLQNIWDIVRTPGVDMIASGKMDLSQALGVPGETDDPRVLEAEREIIGVTVSGGKVPIIKAASKERVRELADMGVRWFHVGRDESLLNGAIKKLIGGIRI